MEEWQLQDAKQRFSALIRAVETNGPQVVTKHGKEVAVVVDIASFERLAWEGDNFKTYLTSGPTADDLTIERSTASADTVELG